MNFTNYPCVSRPPNDAEFGHLTLLYLQRTAGKCTKNYNAREQPLFRSLNLMFSDSLVAVEVFLNSLITDVCRSVKRINVLSLGVVQIKPECSGRLEDESVGFLPGIKFHSLCI